MRIKFMTLFLVLGFLFFSGCLQEETKKESTVVCDDGTVVSSQDQCVSTSKPVTFEERHAYCLKKDLIQEKDECLQQVAIEFNKDSLCDELVNLDSEKCRRFVWKAFAVVSKEVEKCNSLISKFDITECIKEIALNSGDKTVCNEISDFTENGSCLTELAISEQSLSICDSIQGATMKETCKFNTVLAISDDASLCDYFTLPTIKFDCISRIAEKTNNPSLCENISNSALKGKCLRNFDSS